MAAAVAGLGGHDGGVLEVGGEVEVLKLFWEATRRGDLVLAVLVALVLALSAFSPVKHVFLAEVALARSHGLLEAVPDGVAHRARRARRLGERQGRLGQGQRARRRRGEIGAMMLLM